MNETQPWPPLPRDLGSEGTGWSLRTLAVSSGRPKGAGATLNQPLVLASNFRDGGDYARTHGTDSWIAFEDALGALEGGHALCFASGMAVASAILHALMPKVIVLPNASYMGVRTLIADVATGYGLEIRLVDVTNTAEVLSAAEGADLVWLESPTNPTLDVADLGMLCGALAERYVNSVIDSTFATPLGQQPLALGATIVLHSATKFIGGHSDLLLGVAVTRDAAVREALYRARTYVGATPGALETFLALRGLRTLPLRYSASTATAVELAIRLRAHEAVESVRQIGPMMAVILHGGATAADWVCAHLQLMVPATSLGGVETTLERRQKYAGDAHVNPGLLRVSVGIEDVEDLWTDFCQALASVSRP